HPTGSAAGEGAQTEVAAVRHQVGLDGSLAILRLVAWTDAGERGWSAHWGSRHGPVRVRRIGPSEGSHGDRERGSAWAADPRSRGAQSGVPNRGLQRLSTRSG